MKLADLTDRVRRRFDLSDADEAKIAGAIKRNLSINEVEQILGSGSYGIAAAIDKDHVIKFTTDETEIATSHRLVGKKLRHVVRIEGVYLVGGLSYTNWDGKPLAVLIMERMTGTGTRSQSTDEVLTDEMRLARSGHPGRDQASLERRSWDQMLGLRVAAEGGLTRLAQIADGIEELRELRIYVGDVHHENVGWKTVDGKMVLKIFDLGISSAPPTTRKPPTIEEEATVAPTASTPSEPGYIYHATNAERAADIAREGLKPHRPWKFTDQRAWPDGSTEPRVYFTPNAGVAWGFAPEEGRAVLLRVPAFIAQSGDGTGDRFSRKRIPVTYIEILTTEGWVPISTIGGYASTS